MEASPPTVIAAFIPRFRENHRFHLSRMPQIDPNPIRTNPPLPRPHPLRLIRLLRAPNNMLMPLGRQPIPRHLPLRPIRRDPLTQPPRRLHRHTAHLRQRQVLQHIPHSHESGLLRITPDLQRLERRRFDRSASLDEFLPLGGDGGLGGEGGFPGGVADDAAGGVLAVFEALDDVLGEEVGFEVGPVEFDEVEGYGFVVGLAE